MTPEQLKEIKEQLKTLDETSRALYKISLVEKCEKSLLVAKFGESESTKKMESSHRKTHGALIRVENAIEALKIVVNLWENEGSSIKNL